MRFSPRKRLELRKTEHKTKPTKVIMKMNTCQQSEASFFFFFRINAKAPNEASMLKLTGDRTEPGPLLFKDLNRKHL